MERLFRIVLKGLIALIFLFTLSPVAKAQLLYTTNNGAITITGYSGPRGAVVIPSAINGYPVTTIAPWAFWVYLGDSTLTSVTIPDSVTVIGNDAFIGCGALTNVILGNNLKIIQEGAFKDTALASVMIPRSVTDIAESVFNTGSMRTMYFQGNPPKVGVFYNYSLGPESVVLYYVPGTSGWGSFDPASSYRNHPIVLWNPLAQSSGVRSNRFGFNIAGTAGIPIVVEACTNLALGNWSALQSCTVTNGSIYFSDQQWTNYPGRLYRLRSP